tara:strand:- start:4820 stop:6001 length:1182 start_codon:yes stop_codon:yes gene_type:complete
MDRKIKVCEVIASLSINSGGTASFISDLSMYLGDPAFEFQLLTASMPNVENLSIYQSLSVNALPARSGLLGQAIRPGAATALTEMSEADGLNIVHQHGVWLDIFRDTAKWTRRANVDLIVSPHGMLEPWALNHKKWKKKLAWTLYQKNDLQHAKAFHACSEQEAQNIRKLGFKQPIAVIPNGVELPEFPSTTGCEGSKVGKLKGEKKTALFLSRISSKKGLPMLLDAWKKLAPEGWQLVIAGNDYDGYLSVIERKIRELELSEVCKLVGPLFGEAKEAAFRNADLFVLPSYSENFGIVITEALGYQLPVLTTTGCPWQELETEQCGWWVEPTPTGIENGLKAALATSDEQCREMGQRGRSLVERNYLWPAIAEKFRVFYTWISDGGERPDFVV